jgi:hypothetical protein
MQPIDFPEANKNLLKPDGMADDECGSLPVLTDGHICLSLWKPSLRERISILLFGRVWLYVYSGYTQPPVALTGERSVFSKAEDEQ